MLNRLHLATRKCSIITKLMERPNGSPFQRMDWISEIMGAKTDKALDLIEGCFCEKKERPLRTNFTPTFWDYLQNAISDCFEAYDPNMLKHLDEITDYIQGKINRYADTEISADHSSPRLEDALNLIADWTQESFDDDEDQEEWTNFLIFIQRRLRKMEDDNSKNGFAPSKHLTIIWDKGELMDEGKGE